MFYRDRFDSLVIRAQAMTRFDEATCLDLVQDTMLKIATSMPRFNDEQQLNAWINRLIINGARDRIRSASRLHRREASRAAPEQAQPTNDDQVALRKHLDALDEEQVHLLQTRYAFGWTLRQIGERIGLGTSSVDHRLRIALDQLRTNYDEETRDAT